MSGHGAHSYKKNGGNRPRGSASECQKVFCFLLSMQCGLSATYPAPISTIFETTDVNRFRMRTSVKNFRISAQGIFHVPKTAKIKYGTPGAVFLRTLWLKRYNCGRRGSFKGLVDISRMCLLLESFAGGCTVWAL